MNINLQHVVDNHDFWNCGLLDELRSASLSYAELKYFFQEYSYFSVNFTRLLGAALSVMDNDRHRAMLSENLWEESGEKELDERHSVIYKKFLNDVFSIDGSSITNLDSTPVGKEYFQGSLNYCLTHSALETTAFICYGVEGVVSQLYQYFIQGLKPFIKNDKQLLFFELHIECDDEHTATLQKMLEDYQTDPQWDEKCLAAIEAAFQLKIDFFDEVHKTIKEQRVNNVVNIDGKYDASVASCLGLDDFKHEVYSAQKDNVSFSVFRSNIESSIMDVRRVTIAAGLSNEKHSHGHETILYVCEGFGSVEIGENKTPISEGDVIFVPRWVDHKTINMSQKDMTVLAVTDSKLIKQFTRETDSSYRQKPKTEVQSVDKSTSEVALLN